MKITFTIDSELREKLDGVTGKPLFWDTYRLIKLFARNGHEVRVVQSEDAIANEGFSREFFISPGGSEEDQDFTFPDVFFIRGYGLRVGRDCFRNFVRTVKSIEDCIPLVINSGEATSFSGKNKQKSLPLPFIPFHRITSISDVTSLLKDNKKGLILKPDYGLQSAGVEYIRSVADLDNLLKQEIVSERDLIENCSFERFVPDKRETRYVFLGGEMIGSRIAEREGKPGRESLGKRYLNENPDGNELKIARRAIDFTKIDFGCVDFRGGYILEINGSGTQTFYREGVGGGKTFLDITSKIYDEIEKRHNKS